MISIKNGAHKRKVLILLKLVLVLILGHVVVRTVMTPNELGEAGVSNSAASSRNLAAVEPAVISRNSSVDYSAILEGDLFESRVSGRATEEVVLVDEDVNSRQPAENKLKIALLGTVAGSPAVSRAIIKDLETNVLGQYRTGDTVLSASIERIERDRVVLIHRGQREVLTLHAPERGMGSSQIAQASVPASAPQVVEVAQSSKPAATFADRVKQVAMRLPEARLEPHAVRGQVEGLRITDMGNIAGMEDLGLKDGDVICAVNGHRLDSKQKAFQVAMKARSQAALSVELMRDNKLEKYSLPLK